MGLTENRASGLLALNGLDVLPNSAISVEDAEVGLAGMVLRGVVDEEVVAAGLAKRAFGLKREPVSRT
jgi:hypothetical protein